jgi:hypothetical protein
MKCSVVLPVENSILGEWLGTLQKLSANRTMFFPSSRVTQPVEKYVLSFGLFETQEWLRLQKPQCYPKYVLPFFSPNATFGEACSVVQPVRISIQGEWLWIPKGLVLLISVLPSKSPALMKYVLPLFSRNSANRTPCSVVGPVRNSTRKGKCSVRSLPESTMAVSVFVSAQGIEIG